MNNNNNTLTQNQISRTLKRWTADIDNQFNDIKACSEIMKALSNIIYTSLGATEIHVIDSELLSISLLIDDLHVNLSINSGSPEKYLGIRINICNEYFVNQTLYLVLRDESIGNTVPFNTPKISVKTDLIHFSDMYIDTDVIRIFALLGKIHDICYKHTWGLDYMVPGYVTNPIADEAFKLYSIEMDKRISILRKDYKKARFILKRFINNNLDMIQSFSYESHKFQIIYKSNHWNGNNLEIINVTMGVNPDQFLLDFKDSRSMFFEEGNNSIEICLDNMEIKHHGIKDRQGYFMEILNKQLPRIVSLMSKS